MLAAKLVLINPAGRILLQLRSKKAKEGGKWSFFGGRVDDGETPKQAIMREIKEELNYDVDCFEILDKSHERIWFIIKTDKNISEFDLNDGDGFGFFDYDDAVKLDLTENTRMILERHFANSKVYI
ncbi:MAG: NUDIX domain-containing protein [Nanoarchaeota archaeon]